MKFIELSDGTWLKAFSPIEDVPFYSDWLEALLLRRAAFEAPGLKGDIDKETGLPKRRIVPYDRDQEQAFDFLNDGSVGIICIGCATPTPVMDMPTWKSRGHDKAVTHRADKIRIGAIVQFGEEEPVNESYGNGRTVSAVRRWHRRSVSKLGLGCPACVQLYMAEAARVAAENEQKQVYFEAVKLMYTNKGLYNKALTVPAPRLYTPFLDVLSRSVELRQFTPAQEQL